MKRKAITTTMLILFLAAILTTAFNVASVEANPVLFYDDFEDSLKTEKRWEPVSGTWAVEAGEYSMVYSVDYPAYAASYMVDESTNNAITVDDFILEFETKIILNGGTDFTGVFFRTSSGAVLGGDHLLEVEKEPPL